ncbi:MAG: nucleotide exchange factor GrpE [Actinomycetota bacterium]|nr:nucleotide exchange factor GrpE [Actinomycetota bacterium]
MRPGDGTFGDGAAGEEQPRVVVRDKRRIDPVTGEIRVPPAGEQPAGGGVHVDEDRPGAAGVAAGTRETTAELDALQAQLDERTGDLQRISAEYSNYRRRVERDRQLVIDVAKAQVAGALLTVLDDIERAEEHGDLSGPFKAVADKLVAALQAQGLEPFGAVGDGFDPAVHEAVQHSTSPDVHKPTVTAVLRRGYRFGERMLRPAMVAVTDAEAADVESASADPTMYRDAASSSSAELYGDRLGDTEPCGGAEQLRDN